MRRASTTALPPLSECLTLPRLASPGNALPPLAWPTRRSAILKRALALQHGCVRVGYKGESRDYCLVQAQSDFLRSIVSLRQFGQCAGR